MCASLTKASPTRRLRTNGTGCFTALSARRTSPLLHRRPNGWHGWKKRGSACSRYACLLIQLLQHAQHAILRTDAAGKRRSDVLTLGYRRDAVEAKPVHAHPNTLVTSMITGRAWHTLLARMGMPRFYHMLLTTAYYVPLEETHDCFAQMWGEPLGECTALTKRRAASLPRKRRRPRRAHATSANQARLPNVSRPAPVEHTAHAPRTHAAMRPRGACTQRYFRRHRLFYARAVRRYRYGTVLGLPPTHTLSTPGSLAQRTSVLARRIFPLQFKRPPRWSQEYTNDKGHGRWPKRVRTLRPLLRTMLRKHARFHYTAALNACCPSALPRGVHVLPGYASDVGQEGTEPPAPPTLPASLPASTQALPGAEDDGRARRRLQQLAKARSKGEPRYYQYATSLGRVSWYVRTVVRRVVPLALFGSVHNRNQILGGLARFVRARRGERMHLHDILQGIRLSDCSWLGSWQTPRSACEHAKRTELMDEFVYWLVDDLVLPLLRTTFYVTEAAAFRQRVLYFRQDLWERVSAPAIAQLRTQLFEPVPEAAGAPVAQIRLLPKDTAVRPIVNLRRRTSDGISVNAQLQTAFDVLALEAARHPHVYGAAVHGANGIYTKLIAFRQAILQRHGHIPMMYAVRADVRAAFDSLDHAQLLRLVRTLLAPEKDYVVQRYTQHKPSLGRMARSRVRRAYDDTDYPPFLSTRPAARHAVLVDSVAYTLTDTAHVLAQIEAHIQRSLVRFGARLYRQCVGVPQGSVLSTILCNLLLADMEQTHFAALDGCLMRYTDDFLLLTPSRGEAERFCAALDRGFATHGCRIAPEKSLVNFDMVQGATLLRRIAARAPIPWCGYEICPTTLSVRADKGRYPYHFGDTLTVHTGPHPGDVLAQRLLLAVRARTHILFTDTVLNTEQGAAANVLEGFLLVAAKLHAYCRGLRPRRVSPSLLHRAIDQAVRMTHPMIVSRMRLAAASLYAGAACELRRDVVEWLGYFAFYSVLHTVPAYIDLAPWLAGRMHAPRYGTAQARVGRLALRIWEKDRGDLAGRY